MKNAQPCENVFCTSRDMSTEGTGILKIQQKELRFDE